MELQPGRQELKQEQKKTGGKGKEQNKTKQKKTSESVCWAESGHWIQVSLIRRTCSSCGGEQTGREGE